MDSIKKVNAICKKVLALTGDDFKAVEKMANEQIVYVHPLKIAKQLKYNKLGAHNIKVLNALRVLKLTISELDENLK